MGWQCVIYTPSNPEALASDSSLEQDIPSDAEVIKRPILEPYELYRKLMKKSSDKSVNLINDSSKKGFKEKLTLWIRANFFVPDPRVSWVGPSVRYLKKYLVKHPVDVIVSSGPPHSMHLIGSCLSRELNIRHIADFRDPWTTIFYFKHLPLRPAARAKHRRLEGEVLFNADAVVTVTRRISQELKGLFLDYCRRGGFLVGDAQKKKFHVVCNGYDEDDFASAEGSAMVPERSFCITHTGLLSADGNPVTLWKVLGKMCRENRQFQNHLVIKLAGKVDAGVLESIYENGIGGNVVNLGYLSHSESIFLQKKAVLLILPLRNEPEAAGILTGKFFEYMASGRPIFAIGPVDGELAEIMAETATGDIAGWDDTELTKTIIEKRYDNFINGNWNFHSFKEEIEKYSRRKEAEEMAALFEK